MVMVHRLLVKIAEGEWIMGKRMVDIIDDLWSIFECGYCGILFFSEDRVQEHIDSMHKGSDTFNYQNMEFIRAIPQKATDSINGAINP